MSNALQILSDTASRPASPDMDPSTSASIPAVPKKRGRGRPSDYSKQLEKHAIDTANGIIRPLPQPKVSIKPVDENKRGRGRPPGVKNGEGKKHQLKATTSSTPSAPSQKPTAEADDETAPTTSTSSFSASGKRLGRPPGVRNGQGKAPSKKKARSEDDAQPSPSSPLSSARSDQDESGEQRKSAKAAAAVKKGGPTGAKRGRPPKKPVAA